MRPAYLLAFLPLLLAPALRGEDCEPVIVELPAQPITGTTCDAEPKAHEYHGLASCTIEGKTYNGGRVAHRFYLGKAGDQRNSVGFRLDSPDGDLVLVLVRDDGTCVANSPDFVGSGPQFYEEIPTASYPEGYYDLFVDSSSPDDCGGYSLSVRGTNPASLDLPVTVLADGPRKAIAGDARPVPHTLVVENDGDFGAAGIDVDVRTGDRVAGVTLDAWDRDVFDPESGIWTVDSLCPGERSELSLDYRVAASAEEGTTIRTEVTGVKGARLEPESSVTIAETAIRRRIDLRLIQRSTPSQTVVAGTCDGSESTPTALTWRETVVNRGPSDASGIRLLLNVADLPDGVEIAPPEPAAETTFADGVWTLPDLGAGQRASLTTTLQVHAEAPDGATIGRTVEIQSAAEDDRLGDESRSQSLVVERRVELVLGFDPEPPTPVVAGIGGGSPNLVYRLRLRNDGPSEAGDIEVTQDFAVPPEHVVVIRPETREWRPGLLAPACGVEAPPATAEIEDAFVVGPGATGDVVSTVEKVFALGAPCNSGKGCVANIPLRRSTEIASEAELELELRDTADPVHRGMGTVCYELTVSNLGASPAQDVRIHFPHPAELLCNPAPVGMDGCAADCGPFICMPGMETPVLDCDVGELAAGKSKTKTVAIRAQAPARTVANAYANACAAGAGGQLECSNTAHQTTTIADSGDSDLSVVLSGRPSPAIAGRQLVYTVGVTNRGFANARGVMMGFSADPVLEGLDASLVLPAGCGACAEKDDEEPCPATVCCDLGVLATGQSRFIRIGLPAAPPDVQRLQSCAEVHFKNEDSKDPNKSNNLASLEAEVSPSPLDVPALDLVGLILFASLLAAAALRLLD